VNHVIVVDLGYGDAGKGTVVDWLCSRPGRPVHTVVRFNGGAQAAHNVVTPDGRHHAFSQFGAGTFAAGVRTHLSRFALVDPLALAAEAEHLAAVGVRYALARLTVDRHALLVTPYHQAANRLRELRRAGDRHGSCGMGIGQTASYALDYPADAPRTGDCETPGVLARKLTALIDCLRAELGPLDVPPVADVCDAYRAFGASVALVDTGHLGRLLRAGPAVFEGAQGVLLDERYGFHPYTTWSTTTFANAETLLSEAGMGAVRLGVIRCYMTRHGPGPFVTEDPTLELPEPHNQHNRWQGPFRVGQLDAVALRYAIAVSGGVDAVALTHLDVAEYLAGTGRPGLRVCRAYRADGQVVPDISATGAGDALERQERLTRLLLRARPVYGDPADGTPASGVPAADWPSVVEQAAGAPVALVSRGPTAPDKECRRQNWGICGESNRTILGAGV